MSTPQDPVVLELAPLPREQTGPFILLGIDKDAERETIEAHWAQRVIWARKNQIDVPLQDVNWAREVVNDFDKRVKADALSLNTDTCRHALRELAERYGVGDPESPTWQPMDVEKPLADYSPPADVPDIDAVRAGVRLAEIPWEVPGVEQLLADYARQTIDPWTAW